MEQHIEPLDLIVGIPSWCEADSIGHVVEVVDEGIQTYFPDLRACIVNLDNNSPDGTRDAFLNTTTRTPLDYVATPDGIRGKGHNFANLFRLFQASQARVGIVVDADLRSIEPDWIRKLGTPVCRGADYVTPLYARHQFDGTITNHLCYPLTSALTGLEIRQPIGGEFAFGPRFCQRMLEIEWPATAYEYGIDIFMTLNAVFGRMDIRQTVLGSKIHKASAPKLGPMFTQVAHTLFTLFEQHCEIWFDRALQPQATPLWKENVQPVPVENGGELGQPQDLTIDTIAMKQQCRALYAEHEAALGDLLPGAMLSRVAAMVHADHYDMTAEEWATIVYLMLFRYCTWPSEREQLIEAMKPLYFARSLAFDYKTWRYSIRYAEAEIRQQMHTFHWLRPWLYGLFWQQRHRA